MAYATPEQLLSRYDSRVVGQLVDDTGGEVTSLGTNSVVLDALEDASGQIRSAALVANKYSEATLNTLAADQDSFLVRLTCSLALGYLVNRRMMDTAQYPEVIRAEQWLAALRFGERIFNVQDNADAGNIANNVISLQTRNNVRLLADSYRFFPVRQRYN